MVKNVESLLKKFKQNAINEFEKLKADKEYPTPVNCPVSLFGTIKSGCKETAYTRALAYLLNHNETHGFGKDIFVAFCKKIRFQAKSADYDVNAELWNQDKNNRYDIRISGKRTRGTVNPDFLIAIEAKINAGFGKDQLKRYDKDLKNKTDNLKKICLTKESLSKNDLPEDWISLTWKDVASILWNAIEHKEDRSGYAYVRYYISSIYQDIYQNNVQYSDIYDFIDDKNFDSDLIKKLQDCEIDFETLIKYPNTCTAVYWKTEEDSDFDKSYLARCKELALKETALLKDFCDSKKPFTGSSLTALFKYHWHQKEKFEMATWIHGEMDEDYNEQLFLSLSTFTHSNSTIHVLKSILSDEKLPPNKSWWEKDLLLFEEPVKTSDYFSEAKIKELKEKLRCFYKKIKSKKDFK